jgi:membrane protein DedA with SNARE-associated domain
VLAGIGWALGSKWEEFHHEFRYAEYAVVAAIVALLVAGVVRHRRSSRLGRRAEDPAR